MDINLYDLSLKELKDLQSKVAKTIEGYEDRRKKEALAELEDKARSLGFSLAELTGVSGSSRKSSPAAPKFANPLNPSETWSGRGRKPFWFIEAIENGASEDDLRI